MKRKGEEPLLPGLTNFTPNQLFWISSAHRYCARFPDYILRHILPTHKHTPDPFRNNGSVMLSDEFAKDFKCSKGTPMNPITQCQDRSIWSEDSSSKTNGAGKHWGTL